MDNNTCKFVEAWQTYPLLGSYLSQADKIRLASTCSIVRNLTQNSSFWPSLQLTNNPSNHAFISHLKWFSKYLSKCKPKNIHISLYDITPEYASFVVNVFMQGIVQSVQKIDIYCQSEDIHLASSLCFLNIQQLTIRSKCVTNELVQFMSQNLKKLHSLIVIKNDLQFTCKKLSKYMQNPMQRLIIKPYAIEFQELIQISQLSYNTLYQLQMDIQQCSIQNIIKIIKPLQCISKLRLYHLQNFDNDEILYEVLKNQSKIMELALTKSYNFEVSRILQTITSKYLQIIDLTDSKYVNDEDITLLSKSCHNLKEVNLSWCNNISCQGLINLIQNCLKIEILNIAGIKQSKDIIFGKQYNNLMKYFDEEKFNKVKNMLLNCKQIKTEENLYEISNYLTVPVDLNEIKILKRLRILDCQSCNGISDNILKIIFIVNPRVRAYNYYGNYMGLFPNDNQSTFC